MTSLWKGTTNIVAFLFISGVSEISAYGELPLNIPQVLIRREGYLTRTPENENVQIP